MPGNCVQGLDTAWHASSLVSRCRTAVTTAILVHWYISQSLWFSASNVNQHYTTSWHSFLGGWPFCHRHVLLAIRVAVMLSDGCKPMHNSNVVMRDSGHHAEMAEERRSATTVAVALPKRQSTDGSRGGSTSHFLRSWAWKREHRPDRFFTVSCWCFLAWHIRWRTRSRSAVAKRSTCMVACNALPGQASESAYPDSYPRLR